MTEIGEIATHPFGSMVQLSVVKTLELKVVVPSDIFKN